MTSKQNILKAQSITEAVPGTVLRDFQTLLDFIGPEGLRTTGKNHLLPMGRLPELDQRMTRPLQPRLRRPQQHSFPHLHGLYLLLRATGLGITEGQGRTTGRLLLDTDLLDQWQGLNPTERYFNLLEACLLRSKSEMIGGRGGWGHDIPLAIVQTWQRIPPQGISFQDESPLTWLLTYSAKNLYQLALLELFGLLDVERGQPDEGENWRIAAIRHVPFGDALLKSLVSDVSQVLDDLRTIEEQQNSGSVRFGVWQSRLQDAFPEWQNNLYYEPEFQEGVYYFRAALGSVWRRVAIPAELTLDDLAWAIINAFEFDGDHLYGFELRDRDGSLLRFDCIGHENIHTEEMQIGLLPLAEGQSLEFEYDFGAAWQFTVTLEEIDATGQELDKPQVVASRGKAPEEYPDLDFD